MAAVLSRDKKSEKGRKLGLRVKLLAWFLLMSILPAAFIVVVSYSKSRSAIVTQLNSTNLGYIEAVGHEIDAFISRKIDDITNLAKQGSFTALEGAVKDGVAAVYMLGAEGDILASFGAQVSGSVAGEPWFETVKSGKTYYGDYEMSAALGRPTMKVAVPMTLSDGAMVGAVMAEIDLEPIQAILDRVAETQKASGRSGYAFLINRNGIFLGHPQKERVLRDRLSEVGDRNLARVAEEMVSGKSGSGTYTFEGVRKVAVYTPLKGQGAYKGNGWSIALTAPEREVYGLVYEIRDLSLVALLIVVLISYLVAMFVSGGITKFLAVLQRAAASLSNGDLTVQIPAVKIGDEIEDLADAFRQMLLSLRSLVSDVKSSAAEVASTSKELSANADESARATNQIAETIQQVATGAQEQSASAVRGSQAVDTLVHSIQQVAQGAEDQTARLRETSAVVKRMQTSIEESGSVLKALGEKGHEAAQSAAKGASSVRDVLTSMERIDHSSKDVAARIGELSAHSREIGRIVEIISGIADQTNLLALNAAIEAARAGEHGRGFAVVADEVRKLAEQSAREARAIAELIDKITQATDKAVAAMSAGSSDVQAGGMVAKEAEKALLEILESTRATANYIEQLTQAFDVLKESGQSVEKAVAEVASIAEETAASAVEMTRHSGEVKKAIDEIAAVSEESAAASEEVSASTEEMAATIQQMSGSSKALAELAHRLRELVEKFKI